MKNSFKNNIFMIFDKVAELKKRNEFVQKTNSGLVYFTQNLVLKPTQTNFNHNYTYFNRFKDVTRIIIV